LARHESSVDTVANLKAGLAAIVGMLIVAQLAHWTGQPLLLAPLGATSTLLFAQPSSPLAQPVNVMMGYLVGCLVCEAAFFAIPAEWIAVAVAVGATVVLMRALRVTHPPAGALPILAFGQGLHGVRLFAVVFVGSVVLILLALAVHRIPPRRNYPLPAPSRRDARPADVR
jgi:CBS-domain-containing membrane protein